MGGQGGEAYGSPFDIFEQFFGGAGELADARWDDLSAFHCCHVAVACLV